MEEEKFLNKTPKNLTNNKYEDEEQDVRSDGSIKDEIEDCYDVQPVFGRPSLPPKPSLAASINEDLDMDYS